jgi:hypothetical protein
MSVLAEFQEWYNSNCDEDWEHSYGVTIETLDNPGWSVTIDLTDTNLEDKSFTEIQENSSDEKDWLYCRVENFKFRGDGDQFQLERILKIFVDWAKKQNKENWLNPPKKWTDEEFQRFEDETFYASLNDEVESEKCKTESCENNRIKYSVLCRNHHFEMITKRPIPKSN